MLTMDGAYGEGGGQVLRTSLTLSVLTGQPVEIVHIRSGRSKPGLLPQHLTAVRAAAKICDAEVQGADLHSQTLRFSPRSAAQAGAYTFDVAQAAKGGSAGAVCLILQTILLPLVKAEGPSQITLRGGTHVAWSPCFDYIKRVYLPTLARLGIVAKAHIRKWGWYPLGGGEIVATVQGLGPEATWSGLDLRQRGSLLRVRGISASSNLPKHIRTRQENTALHMLRSHGVNARVDSLETPSKGQGTVVFVWAEFEGGQAGFTALGERGKPAERVAEEAVEGFLRYRESGAALDQNLADQVVLPLALADSSSALTTEAVSEHLRTNAWVVNQFLPDRVRVEGEPGQPGTCRIGGSGLPTVLAAPEMGAASAN